MALGSELSIGQLAARCGMAVSAIRYYEAQGLIRANRNAGGHRRYRRDVIRRLSFIQISKQFGFSLERIRKELASLPEERAPSPEEWSRIGKGFRTELDAQIETLTRLRDNLDGCIGCGCLSLASCKLYNPQDRAAQNGSGPRYLMGDRPEDPAVAGNG